MISYTHFGLSTAYFFFDEEPQEVNVDIVRCYQSPVRRNGFLCTPFYTRIIDLRRPVSDITGEMHRDTRKQVRRAESADGMMYAYGGAETPDLVDAVCRLHEHLASQKSLVLVDRGLVRALASAGNLDVSVVRDPAGMILAWHVNYLNAKRVRILFGGSRFRDFQDSGKRNWVGRANRMIVLKDIVRFHDLGNSEYDLGGWYVGNGDQEKLRINSSKAEFGGQVVEEYHCVHGSTWAGKAWVSAARARASFRALSGSLHEPFRARADRWMPWRRSSDESPHSCGN